MSEKEFVLLGIVLDALHIHMNMRDVRGHYVQHSSHLF